MNSFPFVSTDPKQLTDLTNNDINDSSLLEISLKCRDVVFAWGSFKIISYGDGTTDFGNTDYYAYLQGILTFNNPEVTNINVFVTPGIDYVNNSNLVESAIDMIENERFNFNTSWMTDGNSTSDKIINILKRCCNDIHCYGL
jgi:hypothetical protein